MTITSVPKTTKQDDTPFENPMQAYRALSDALYLLGKYKGALNEAYTKNPDPLAESPDEVTTKLYRAIMFYQGQLLGK